MTDDKKPTRVIMIAQPHRSAKTLALMLAQAYGAGTIKQGQIAGEYPPPDMLEDLKPMGGTVTGRFSSSKPNIREQEPSRDYRPAQDPRTEHLAEIDFSKIEERILAHFGADEPPRDLGRFNCRGDYVVPDEHPADKWAGVDKRTLSDFDQARRFVDLYSMGPTKMGVPVAVPAAQYFAQLEAASKTMIEWAAKMRADGWVQGEGAANDEWTKERSVIDLPQMLKDAGIDEAQLPGWELRVENDGYSRVEGSDTLWEKFNETD